MAPLTELHHAQDDVSDYAQRFAPIRSSIPDLRAPVRYVPRTALLSNTAVLDSLTDDQIEQLTDEADMAASAERLEDVKHDMRSEWERARFWAGGLNPPKLPIVEGGQLRLISFPEVLALCGETNHLYVMLADVFRGADSQAMQTHLRSVWIDGYAQALADCGWSA